jgi:hypothetical protein
MQKNILVSLFIMSLATCLPQKAKAIEPDELLLVVGAASALIAGTAFGGLAYNSYRQRKDDKFLDEAYGDVERIGLKYFPMYQSVQGLAQAGQGKDALLQAKLFEFEGRLRTVIDGDDNLTIHDLIACLERDIRLLVSNHKRVDGLCKKWHDSFKRYESYKLAKNISAKIAEATELVKYLKKLLKRHESFFVLGQLHGEIQGKEWSRLVRSAQSYAQSYVNDDIRRFVNAEYATNEKYPFTCFYNVMSDIYRRYKEAADSCYEACERTEHMAYLLSIWDAMELLYTLVLESPEFARERVLVKRDKETERLIVAQEKSARAQERKARAAEQAVREQAKANRINKERNGLLNRLNHLIRDLRFRYDSGGKGCCPSRDSLGELRNILNEIEKLKYS